MGREESAPPSPGGNTHTSRCAVTYRPPGGAAGSQTGPEREGGAREGGSDRKTDRERERYTFIWSLVLLSYTCDDIMQFSIGEVIHMNQ